MMLYTAYFLPFHQRFTNIIVVGCLSSSTIEAFIAYISTVAKSHGFNAIIAFVVLVLPAFFAGFVKIFSTSHIQDLYLRISALNTCTMLQMTFKNHSL